MAEQNTPPRRLTDVPGLSTWNDKNGINVEGQHYTWGEVSRDEGLRSVAQGRTNTIYYSVNGGFTSNPSLSVASGGLSLNTETGDINVNASDNILNSSFYKNDLKPQLLQLSQAYKLNPDYKFKYTKYNEDGTTEEAETTVPEYVNRLNEGLLSYVDTVNRAKQNLSTYADKYGDKAYNLSDEQIVMSVDIGGKTIPIPDYLLRDPKFSSLKDKVANGRVSLEDFAKVYDRDNLGRQEMAELLGGIETRLQYADWGDDWYEGENGEQIYNENGANEAAKMIAFREYILANDPKSEWYQAVGDNLNSAAMNALYGANQVFLGIANDAEAILTLGNGKLVQNEVKEMNRAFEQWNTENMLVNDATQWLAAAGYIGGIIGGTVLTGKVAGAVGRDVSGAVARTAGESLTNAANTVSTMFGPSAQAALSAKTMASIVKSSDEITRGARFLMKVAPLAEKVGWATSFANDVKAVMSQHKALSAILGTPVAIMLDTIHDTLLYNSADLRDVLEASDQDTRDYWLGELANNAAWWLGWETIKGTLKGSRWVVKGADRAAMSGKMGTVGLVASKYVNKAVAGVGDAKARLKDKLAGGDLVAKLQTKIDEAIEKGDVRKAGRLNNKKVITEQNSILRAARREFGDVDLNLEGLRLSDKTVSDLVEKGSAIRFWENSIDRFISGVREVRSEMIGGIRNPATGKITFVNPTLAAANTKATDYYMKLADLAKKYHLKVAKDSFISQDMIDYTMTIYDIHRYSVIADGNGPNASKAAEAVERLNANLEALEGKLPDEIKTYIANNYWEAYTNFYTELNKYGIAKKLLNETKLSSYMNSKEWQEIGYMPSIKLQEETGHRVIDTDGKISATIEQEFGQLTYAVQEGQHYIDPELTRQSRINRMAQAQVNAEMLNSYVANTGAAFTTVMGGETTDYVERVMNGKKALEKSIDSYTREFADYFEIRQPRGKVSPLKNKVVPIGERDVAISTFTLTETKQILTDMGVLPGVGENSLVQGVTEENFDDWYNMLNKRAQRFLDAKFADYGIDNVPVQRQTVETTGEAVQAQRGGKTEAPVTRQSYEYTPLFRGQGTGTDDLYLNRADRKSATIGDGYFLSTDRGVSTGFTETGGGVVSPLIEQRKIASKDEVRETFSNAEKVVSDSKEYAALQKENPRLADLYDEAAAGHYEAVAKITGKPAVAYIDAPSGNDEFLYYKGIDSDLDSELKSQFGDEVLDRARANYATYEFNDGSTPEVVFSEMEEWRELPLSERTALIDQIEDRMIDDSDTARDMLRQRHAEYYSSSAESYVNTAYEAPSASRFSTLQEIVQREGDDFELGLQQAYLIGDKDFARSSLLRQALQNLEDGRTAFYEGVTKEQAISALRQIVGNDVNLSELVDDIYASFRTATDDFVSTMLNDGGVKAAFDAMNKDALAPEQSAKYLALKALKEKGRDNVTQSLDKAIKATTDELKLNEADAVKFRKKVQTMFDDYLDNQIDDAANAVKSQGGQVIDPEEVFDEVSKLNKEILALEKEVRSPVEDSTRIMFLDQQGRQAFAQVDPAFASLYNRRYVLEGGEANALAKFNAAMSKIFRYGTTSVNIASMGNQLFRDFGDALMLGGAWRTIKNSADDLQHVWGKNIVEQIKAFDPTGYEMRQVEAFATANGLTTEEAAALRELSKGAARAPSSTERQIYKDLWKKLEKDSETKMEQMKTSLGEWVEKLNPDEIVNGKRENYLRNRVFANEYNDALQRGYTVQQAREFATFAMNNATTNFGRQVYHLQAIAESTPYFSAAINGHKSFWRMWAMDPIGITSRITGGLIFPTIALVGMSLGDPENREIYEKIPEYQKANSLVFVINKQVLSIPIPQQIAAVVAPFRQFTEYLYGANKNDFWELMMNDALGFVPYDLQGFSTIDVDRMLGDPDLGDRINRGFARLFSQMAPVPVKTAYMLATHTDPYTGKTLQDSSYWYWNEETGSTELMDYTQNAFAKMLADNGILGANATVWQKVLTGLFGQTGTDVLDDITTVFTKGLEQGGRTTVKNILGQATRPFSMEVYNPVDGAWRRAVNALTQEKEAILADKETKALLTELQQTSDPEKRQKINAKLQDRVNEFHQKVDNMVKRLSSEYGGSLDRYKLGAVVQLLNFNTDPAWQTGTQYSSDTASAEYYDGRTVAYQMMSQMGIRGAEDLSMLGYSVIDENTGRPAMKYTKPTAILDLKYTTYAQNDINLANLTATITDADLWNKHESVKKQMDALYSAKDYNKYEAVQINWNAEVAKTIAPYLSQMTPEAALNNTQVLNYLYPLIEVPYSWEKNNYGKSVSLGSRGNKKKAYYDSWIKTMFSVNDKYKGQY